MGSIGSPTRTLLASSGRSARFRRKTWVPDATNPLAKKTTIDPNVIYLVPTPIGNVKDMTLRGLEVLKRVDYIVCASRRVTTFLLDTIDVDYRGRLINYMNNSHSHNKVVELLKGGASMAFVVSVGMPCVGDVGTDFVRAMASEGVRISALPGADAVTSALSMSGVQQVDGSFFFGNHFSRVYTERMKQLTQGFERDYPSIFFCRAERLLSVLTEAAALNPKGKLSIVHEISKVHESVHYDTAKSLMGFYSAAPSRHGLNNKGECVVIMEGAGIPGGVVIDKAGQTSADSNAVFIVGAAGSSSSSPLLPSERFKAVQLHDLVPLPIQTELLRCIETVIVTNRQDDEKLTTSVHQLAVPSSAPSKPMDLPEAIALGQAASGLSANLVQKVILAAGGIEAMTSAQPKSAAPRPQPDEFTPPKATTPSTKSPQRSQRQQRLQERKRELKDKVVQTTIRRDLQALRMLRQP